MAKVSPIQAVMAAMHRPVYEARLRTLLGLIAPHLKQGDRVLDVGCGVGTLGKGLMNSPEAPRELVVEGLERHVRGGEPITVHAYGGGAMPFADGAYDVVILADVLHHEEEPDELLGECLRVAGRFLIIKDHQIKGPLAQARVSFIDWAANAPYGVKCLYRYHTRAEWQAMAKRFGAAVVMEHRSIKLYPFGVNMVFGNALQYMAVWQSPVGAPVDGNKEASGPPLSASATPPDEDDDS